MDTDWWLSVWSTFPNISPVKLTNRMFNYGEFYNKIVFTSKNMIIAVYKILVDM